MECGVLAPATERHFKADNMRDLFENINMDDTIYQPLHSGRIWHKVNF